MLPVCGAVQDTAAEETEKVAPERTENLSPHGGTAAASPGTGEMDTPQYHACLLFLQLPEGQEDCKGDMFCLRKGSGNRWGTA